MVEILHNPDFSKWPEGRSTLVLMDELSRFEPKTGKVRLEDLSFQQMHEMANDLFIVGIDITSEVIEEAKRRLESKRELTGRKR